MVEELSELLVRQEQKMVIHRLPQIYAGKIPRREFCLLIPAPHNKVEGLKLLTQPVRLG